MNLIVKTEVTNTYIGKIAICLTCKRVPLAIRPILAVKIAVSRNVYNYYNEERSLGAKNTKHVSPRWAEESTEVSFHLFHVDLPKTSLMKNFFYTDALHTRRLKRGWVLNVNPAISGINLLNFRAIAIQFMVPPPPRIKLGRISDAAKTRHPRIGKWCHKRDIWTGWHCELKSWSNLYCVSFN